MKKMDRESQREKEKLQNIKDMPPNKDNNTVKALATYKGLRILVAEDNELNQLLIRRILEKMGHTCDTVNNGQQAVERAGDYAYDLILIDIQLPLMDGWEATRHIRSRSDICQPRIIAVTAYTSREDKEACKAAGMDGFIAKPINFEDLRKVLDESSQENRKASTTR